MKSFSGNDLAERQKSASAAKQAMLKKFNSAQKLDDPKWASERAERASEKAERLQAAKADKAEAVEVEAAEHEPANERQQSLTEEAKKAERDRRYASRKNRK